MESTLGLNPYTAQLMMWFLGLIAVSLCGTLICFVAGLANQQRS